MGCRKSRMSSVAINWEVVLPFPYHKHESFMDLSPVIHEGIQYQVAHGLTFHVLYPKLSAYEIGASQSGSILFSKGICQCLETV